MSGRGRSNSGQGGQGFTRKHNGGGGSNLTNNGQQGNNVDEDAEIKAYSNTASAVDIVISYEEIDDV